MSYRYLTAVLVPALLCTSMFMTGCQKSEAKSQPSVVLYCAADQDFAEKAVARFTEKTGIRVLPRFDVEATKTLGLVQRLRSESGKPQADVFWSGEVFETIRLANDGLLASHTSETTEAWPKRYSDSQGRWYAFALRARVLAYNTRKVKPSEAPKSVEDLLDPRWKGQLIMARPQFGTTRGHVSAMYVDYGAAPFEDILKGLARNQIRLVSGNSTAVRLVAEGQGKVCFTDTDDVWVAQRNGWPVELVYPKHGKAGTLVIPNTAAVVRGCPHPMQAGMLVDFLLSAEVEEMLARSDSHNVPVRTEVAARFPKYQIPEPMVVDYAKVAEAVDPAVRKATEILKQ